MNSIIAFSLILVCAVFISACSQILLKKEAYKEHKSLLSEYLNYRVICAYALFGVSLIVSLYVLRHIPLSLVPVIESVGYVFVTVLGWVFLKEQIRKRQLLGMGLIIVGVIIFSF